MKKNKKNHLLERIVNIFTDKPKGEVLDLGCGSGDYSEGINDLGFKVVSADMDEARFKYKNEIEFKRCDLADKLPFPDSRFDYILFLEVVEHLRNPYAVIRELSRILKDGGKLIISTPNILNLSSRWRFLFEGTFEFFREPLLEQVISYNGDTKNLHLIPWRYQELEYVLYENGLKVENIYTDMPNSKAKMLSFLVPFLALQSYMKAKRAQKKGDISYDRINKALLSKELLFGRHLIVEAIKEFHIQF